MDAVELDRVRMLRENGSSPKEVARALGIPPAKAKTLIRAIAAAEETDPALRAVVECWVSRGWRQGLTVTGHDEWRDDPSHGDGMSGLAAVLVARDAGRAGSAHVGTWSTSTASGSRTPWGRG